MISSSCLSTPRRSHKSSRCTHTFVGPVYGAVPAFWGTVRQFYWKYRRNCAQLSSAWTTGWGWGRGYPWKSGACRSFSDRPSGRDSSSSPS